ncbi:GNAT family N-acetyltransferase [Cognatishimia maritima]|uniref:L-amino acid N-acyltransferase YncA n=1 Tax=Cognatishimia maritima TaxID=870908 RepID=A0A1M5PGV1_9RHOB|nr:GNAT family N-acetyltransferase [Cognatishimia maritima]SHH01000.1 L-amino acid N-acyltransferase YncA [Cognatishimia maritima]
MKNITVRPAGALDCRGMADLLNDVIKIGGTTAYVTPFSTEMMKAKVKEPGTVWHVAETDAGEIVGFQWLERNPDLDKNSMSIATFTKVGATGLGIGSKLFDVTRKAAIDLGYTYIHAIIRADNDSGLTYYQSRGFEDVQRLRSQKLDDGTIVDKIVKRYRL